MADLVTTHPRLLSAGAMSLHRRLALLHTLCGTGLPPMLRAPPPLLAAPPPTLHPNPPQGSPRPRPAGECRRLVEANPHPLPPPSPSLRPQLCRRPCGSRPTSA